MKNISIILIIVLFCLTLKLVGQTDTLKQHEEIKAVNTIYLEVLGTGGYGSINYERQAIVFTKSHYDRARLAIRLGLSTYNIKDYTTKFNPDIIIPITIIALYGNKHKAELGFGQTIASIVEANFTEEKTNRDTNIHAHFTIGYRYQKSTKGIMFRVVYTPIIEFYKNYRNWGGVSIGYTF